MNNLWQIGALAVVIVYLLRKFRSKTSSSAEQESEESYIPTLASMSPTPTTPGDATVSFNEEDYNYDVVGENFQRDHLTSLIRAHKAFDVGVIFATAILEPEPANEFDSTAVKVMIEGTQVGYIPKFDSPTVTRMIAKSGKPTMEVKAKVGWDVDSPSPFVGVRLILALDQ
jgi:hypothetical protein